MKQHCQGIYTTFWNCYHEGVFLEFTLILIIASVLGLIVKSLRLPLILAYILTGILISPLSLVQSTSLEFFHTLSSLGVAFLLFLVGLEMRLTEVKRIGRSALATGVGQVIFTFVLGFFAATQLFGFSNVTSTYLAIGLSFSSTIIIVKLLSEKGDLSSLYGRISIGFLLVQDLIAILALMFLAAFAQNQTFNLATLVLVFIKGIFLLALALLVSKFITQRLFEKFAVNSELILLAAIAWALLWSAFTKLLGFSLEIGAFLAGLTLSSSFFNLEIAAKIKPLRDFLIIVFFVTLGLSMTFTNFSANVAAILFFSLLVLVGNPLILLIILGIFLGHKRHTAFMAGLTVSQISEFSLIVAAVGLNLGHLKPEEVALLTVVAVITITLSSYMVQEGDRLYQWLAPYLGVFEKGRSRVEGRGSKKEDRESKIKNHVVLVGAHRMGSEFLKEFERMKVPVLVVDFDPEIIENVQAKRFATKVYPIYGDIADVGLLEDLNLEQVKLLISTVPKLEDNLFLLEKAKGINPQLPIVVTADQAWEAQILYDKGADFVILPQFLAGSAVAHFFEKSWSKLDFSQLQN